jgi:DNA repair protein RadD
VSMSVEISSVVLRFGDATLRELLGEETLALVRHIDPRLLESNALRRLVLGVDNGFSLLSEDVGWRAIVDTLSQIDAEALCRVLGLEGGSPYALLDGCIFSEQSDLQKQKTLNFFRINPPEEPYVEASQPISVIEPQYSLFGHQRLPAQEVLRHLRRDESRCILHLPTGGGKTRTSMVVVCRWLLDNPGSSVVWLAASRELLEQASTEFQRAWKSIGDRSIQLLRVWGNKPLPQIDYEDTFVVGGLSKMAIAMSNDPAKFTGLLSKVSLVVFDEAHQALAPTYRELVEFLVGENRGVALLGLTATPGRTPDNDIEDAQLAEFFGLNRVTISMPGFKNPIDYLTTQGFLAKANYIDVEFESQKLNRVAVSDEDADFSGEVLRNLGNDQQRNAELVRAAIALSARHNRILLFAPSVESAHQIGMVLRAVGLDSYSLDGATSELSRKTMIDKFRGNSAGTQILCNYGVLTTGFDAPRTSCVIIGRPTKSIVLYSQMVGRAIRGTKVGGNTEADIVTVVDTSLRGFGAVSEGFNFWNNKWW